MAVTVTHATVTAVPDDPAYDIGSDEWNAAHTVTNALDKTGDTMTGTLAHAVGTITASTPAIDISQTWNDAGVVFHVNKTTITRTAYAAGSTLASWVNPVTSIAVIDHGNGVLSFGKFGDSAGTIRLGDVGNSYLYASNASITGHWVGVDNASKLRLDSKGTFCWSQTQNDATDSADAGVSRNAAGVVEINNGTLGTYRDLKARNVVTPGVTVANLAGAAQGARSFVTDATQTLTAGIGAVVAGGGANAVPVVYDGTNWRIG